MIQPRPIVVISRCIDFDSCRYDGQVIRASLREKLEPLVDLRPICPELEIGLGVPRDPVRLERAEDRAVFHSASEDAGHRTGPGLFAARVLERFPRAAIEDESRLADEAVRRAFLDKVFALAVERLEKPLG